MECFPDLEHLVSDWVLDSATLSCVPPVFFSGCLLSGRSSCMPVETAKLLFPAVLVMTSHCVTRASCKPPMEQNTKKNILRKHENYICHYFRLPILSVVEDFCLLQGFYQSCSVLQFLFHAMHVLLQLHTGIFKVLREFFAVCTI